MLNKNEEKLYNEYMENKSMDYNQERKLFLRRKEENTEKFHNYSTFENDIYYEKPKNNIEKGSTKADEYFNFYTNPIDFYNVFQAFGKLLCFNILFQIFSNAQLSIILTFVNKEYPKDEILTSSIGIVNTLMNLLVYPFILGVIASFEILGSQSYGVKKYNLFLNIIHKIRMICNLFIISSSIITYLSLDRILSIWKIEENLKIGSAQILFIRLISVFFEFETLIKLRYIQIINKSSHALLIIILNGLSLPFFAYTFIILLRMHDFGCGCIYLSNNILLLISLITYLKVIKFSENDLHEFPSNSKYLRNPESQQQNFYSKNTKEDTQNQLKNDFIDCYSIKQINCSKNEVLMYSTSKEKLSNINNIPNKCRDSCFQNYDLYYSYSNLLVIILPLFLISLMDNLSVESMSIYANYFDSKSYSEFINAYSLYGLIGTISISFNTTSSIMISSNIGIGSAEKLQKLFFYILLIGISIALCLGSFLYLFSQEILKILLQSQIISENTQKMFYLSIMCNMIDIIQYVLLSTLKSFGYIYLSFCIYFFGNMMNFSLIYFFGFHTNMKIFGIFFGYYLNEIITAFMYTLSFIFVFDFKSSEQLKEHLNKTNEF